MINKEFLSLKTGSVPKTIIVSGLIFIILAILLPVFIFPRINTIVQVRSELNTGKESLNGLTVKLNQLLETDKVGARNKLAKVNNILPSTKDIPGLMLGLERLTYEASVSMEAVQLSPGNINKEKQEGTGTANVQFQLIIKGNLANIKDFLKKVFTSGRLLGVKSLHLSSSAADGQITASVDMEAFYQPLPESMGKINDPLPVISEEENQVYQRISRN